MGCSDSKPTHQSNGNGKVKPTPANKTKDEERVNRRDMPKLDQTERRKSMAPDRKSIDAARSATPTGSDQMSAKGSPKHEPDNTSHEPDSTHGIARPPSPKSEEKSTDKSDKSLHHSDSCSRLESDSDIQDITAGSPGNATPMSLSPVAHPAMTPNSPLDTANFDEANVGYDLIDSYDYDAAFKKLMELVKKRDGRMNLVALAGVSSMHGLGGEAWARVSSASVSEVPHQVKEAAEAWLRQRHLSKRATPAFGSPAALLALTELYRMRDKDAPEDFGLQCIYLPTPHPLALLRHSTDTLATFKKERTKDMNPAKLKEMEIEKKVLLRNFDALSKPNTRIGAKAGKYLWMSFYKVLHTYNSPHPPLFSSVFGAEILEFNFYLIKTNPLLLHLTLTSGSGRICTRPGTNLPHAGTCHPLRNGECQGDAAIPSKGAGQAWWRALTGDDLTA